MGAHAYDVLLVEDNPRDVFVMREIVARSKSTDFRLAHASSVHDALMYLRNQRFDLILLDLTLPDSSGFSTFESLRNVAQRTPLILMTAVDDEETAARVVREGAQDYLVKGSLTPDLVLRAMRHAVERKRVEEALRESRDKYERLQTKYHSILRSTPNGICMLTPRWQVSFANTAMLKLLYPRADSQTTDLIGSEFAIFFADRGAFEQFRTAALAGVRQKGVERREAELIRLDGTTVACELTLTRVDPSETESGYVLTAVDITEQKRAKLEREVLSWLAFQLSGARTVEQIGGYVQAATEELWNWSGFCLALEATPGVFQTVLRTVFDGATERLLPTLRFELSATELLVEELLAGAPRRSDFGTGTRLPVLPWLPEHNSAGGCFLAAPVRDGERMVGLLAVSSTSFLDTFHAEDEFLLQRLADVIGPALERCLSAAERMQLAAAVEQSSDGISITDIDWVVRYVNPAFEKITGYGPQEVIGSKMPVILAGGDYEHLFYAAIRETLSRGEPWNGRVTAKKKDGSNYEEELRIAPIRDDAGRITHYVLARCDVTREAALAAEVRQKQKMEAVGMLAGGIAHDFNNILQVAVGQAQLLLMRMEDNDPTREDVERILSAGRRGAALTRQLLVFSRKEQLEPQILSIGKVLSGLENMVARTIGEDICLQVENDGSVGLVNADPGQLEQVMLNLVVNARDAMPEGGCIRITLEDQDVLEPINGTVPRVEPGEYVVLRVSDTGVGMPPEVQERIFEPFFTTKEVGQGTGLGLSTVYGIVKQSGGEIVVRSAPGAGTTFEVYLPRVSPHAEISMPECETSRRLENPFAGETVLLVEDQSEVRMLVRMLLCDFGSRVLEACNGEEALLVAENHPETIHLLLSDVVMPGLSGPELARHLRASHPETRVLLMTGYTDRAFRGRAQTQNEFPLIYKPFEPDALLARLREALNPSSAV